MSAVQGLSGRVARHWWVWLALVAVVAGALVFSTTRTVVTHETLAQRVDAIASQLKCPSCEALSVAQSNAFTAVAVRRIIASRLKEGESAHEIDSYFVTRYGTDMLLRPPAHGVDLLVWIIPSALVFFGLGAVLLFFWRRRRELVGEDPDMDEIDSTTLESVEALLARRREHDGESLPGPASYGESHEGAGVRGSSS